MDFEIVPVVDAAELVAFERAQGTPRFPAEVARRVDVDPGGTLVARARDGRILGAGSVVVHRDAGEGAYAFVGGVLVDPPARRLGIARALLRTGLARAETLGATRVALAASALGRPLYASEGFRDVATSARWERKGPPVDAAPSGARTVSIYPISSCEIMELLKYDAPRFGANRGPLMASIMGAFPERSFVAFDRASGAIVGFVGTQERVVGPWVADSDEAASRLLHAALQAGAPPRVLLSGRNPGAERVAAAAGFAPDGTTCAWMAKGDAPGREHAIYGLAAWALG